MNKQSECVVGIILQGSDCHQPFKFADNRDSDTGHVLDLGIVFNN